jgi:hypothetical protein
MRPSEGYYDLAELILPQRSDVEDVPCREAERADVLVIEHG